MALIACHECGKEISDTAGACPHCGAPRSNAAVGEEKKFVWNKKITIPAIVVSMVVIVWFYFTPYLAINNLKDAVAKKDYETVSTYIDFTSLKESIKTQLNASIAKDISEKDKSNPFAGLAMAFVAPMVDAMVTPENMTRIIGGKDPIIDKADEQKILASDVDEKVDLSMGYKDFNTFSVDVKSSKKVITFIFHRDGLFSWKLAGLKLPEKEPSKAVAPMPPQEAVTVEAVPSEFDSAPMPSQKSNYIFEKQLQLTGVLGSGVGGIGEEGDPDFKQINYPMLILSKPISVKCSNEDECSPVEGTTEIQLSLNESGMKLYKRSKGQSVVVTGTLTPMMTAHHYTPAIMMVDTLTIGK